MSTTNILGGNSVINFHNIQFLSESNKETLAGILGSLRVMTNTQKRVHALCLGQGKEEPKSEIPLPELCSNFSDDNINFIAKVFSPIYLSKDLRKLKDHQLIDLLERYPDAIDNVVLGTLMTQLKNCQDLIILDRALKFIQEYTEGINIANCSLRFKQQYGRFKKDVEAKRAKKDLKRGRVGSFLRSSRERRAI